MDTTTGVPPMIGRKLSIPEWLDYCASYDFGRIAPVRVVLHHTYRPDETQWRGLTSMRGMQKFYRDKGWTAAPHIYTAPDGIWLFTPMRNAGIHAGTGNSGVWNGKWGYSIGLEMVGYFDKKLPSGIVWSESLAVMGALSQRLNIPPRQLISFHRDYTNEKSCPGWKVTKDWVWGEVENWLASKVPVMPTPAPPAFEPVTVNSTLIAPPRATAQQAINYIISRGPNAYDDHHLANKHTSIKAIVAHYWRYGPDYGLDPLILIAQCIHETSERYPKPTDGYKPLSSWWAARPRRNPAGLGVTGEIHTGNVSPNPLEWAKDDRLGYWRRGLSFPNWEESVKHHCGRLLAYALKIGEGTDAQKALIQLALQRRPLPPHYRGIAQTLMGLVQTWAVSKVRPPAGQTYADKIAAIANAIQQTGG